MATGGEEGVVHSPANDVVSDETKHTDDREWDQYFMGVALISAQRSKDPNKQVGACIVNLKKRIVGVGYNGMPDRGIENNDVKFIWGKDPEKENKHWYVCHAEMNAIVNKMGADLQDCTIYTTLYPCNECSKLIIQSGIRNVVYLEYREFAESRVLLETAKIKIEPYKPKGNSKSLVEALKKLESN